MKIEKNKIVFGTVIAVILIFLISYAVLIIDSEERGNFHLKNTLIPELEEEAKEYDSKLDAVNDLKEVREANAPQYLR